MATWNERACTALEIYYERGVGALGFLQQGQWDEANELLNKRTAAFHNFRAADYLALQAGYTVEEESKLRDIWSKIAKIDPQIIDAIRQAQLGMEAELVRISRVKTTISRFRSGQVQESSIEKSV